MLKWYRTLTTAERLTFLACFAGWALDAMDNYGTNFILPTIGKVFRISPAEVGLMATMALLASGVGGWVAGALSDKIGRVRVLQITIAWFSLGSLLCGFAENFPQLVAFRVFQGIGFGGEWAAGAVLIGEITKPQYRATAVGAVQSGYSIGVATATGLYFVTYSVFPPEMAWRAIFWAGFLPAFLLIFISRSVKEPVRLKTAENDAALKAKFGFLAIFGRPLLRFTLSASILSVAIQGASYGIAVWVPSVLRTERGFSVGETSSFFIAQSIGSFIGYLSSALLADKIGRRGSFWVFTVGAFFSTVCLTLVPMGVGSTIAIAIPFGFFALGVYSNFGPLLTELYPTALRGSGQGFCYNVGRAFGAAFPALVGHLSASMTLSTSIASVSLISYVIASLIVFILPETKGKVISDIVSDTAVNQPA